MQLEIATNFPSNKNKTFAHLIEWYIIIVNWYSNDKHIKSTYEELGMKLKLMYRFGCVNENKNS